MSEHEEEREELDERGPSGQHPSDHRKREREAQPVPITHHEAERTVEEHMAETQREHAERLRRHMAR